MASRQWKGVPVPFFFQRETAEAFKGMSMRDDDVILSSLTKGGTTWMHKILYQLLHGIGPDGNPTGAATDSSIGSQNQVYPEALVLRRGEAGDPEVKPEAEAMRKKFFGEWGFEDDMCGQPAPRLISTHLFGDFLPTELIAPDGKGRLVVVLRNLKDTLASLHFFRGEPKDGWLGNEHGPGSLARFIDPNCPNAYGSCFNIIKENDRLVRAIANRALVVYYEDLCRNTPAQIDRVADFLGVELTAEKRQAVIESVSFASMKQQGGMSEMLLRKGGYGDWKNHMGPAEWGQVDARFDEVLEGVGLAEPLRHYQRDGVGGLPPPRAEQTMAVDPRQWPKFVRHTLVEGRLVRDTLIAAGGSGTFQRPPSEFNGIISPPGTPGATHEAEAGRYHLFVSGVCPWANGTRAARHMLGLEDVISMDVADGQSGGGWVMMEGTSCPPWKESPGPFYLHQVYQASDPLGTTRITMPVLWDTKLACIVSNDSWSILKMMSTAFRPLAKPGAPDLLPGHIADEMEAVHAALYEALLNGVYNAGINLVKNNLEAAQEAADKVYATLDQLEGKLSQQRFLMATSAPSAVDIRLTMTLLRYDSSYRQGFALRGGRGGILVGDEAAGAGEAEGGYPALRGYLRDMFALLKPCVDWPAFRQYYRWAPGLPPHEPLPDLERIAQAAEAAHDRHTLP